MKSKDSRIDRYIDHSADFAKPILKHLRKLVHKGCPGVEETLKWGFPHFMYKGMLCSMAAFKQHCSFGFWKRALVMGPATNSENRGMGVFGRITSLSDLPSDKVLLGYIKKAASLNDRGVKMLPKSRPKVGKKLVIPEALKAALRRNHKALATFEAFSYSHKKEYIEWITEAKRDETRQKRLATTLDWLAKGKPRHWKYMNC